MNGRTIFASILVVNAVVSFVFILQLRTATRQDSLDPIVTDIVTAPSITTESYETIVKNDTEEAETEQITIGVENAETYYAVQAEPIESTTAVGGEYPIATEIWLIMKEFGWTDAACAGIMGNIMRETGGDSLEYIDPYLFNKGRTHFGLCQWSKKWYPAIYPTGQEMPTIREQLEFLRLTINEYNGKGFVYGFTEDYLKVATDCKEVAKKFCDGYERPGGSSSRREKNAVAAYNYFCK